MTSQKIAVIGGSGFVGTSLCEDFEKDNITYEIFDINTNIPNKKIKFADIRDYAALDVIEDCTCIINLAAEHRDDVYPISKYDDVNVIGSENICKLAEEKDINKIIFVSSVAVYGFTSNATDENGKIDYFNDYGRTKFLAEEVYKKWYLNDIENRKLVIIRPTVIFGPGNRGNVFNLFNQIAKNQFVMIGKGNNIKSIAYVKNVTKFINHCLTLDNDIHIYNYVDKPDHTIKKLVSSVRNILFNKKNIGIQLPVFIGKAIGYLADIISSIFGIKLPISSIRIEKFLKNSHFVSSAHKTGFKQEISLDDAIKKTITYEFIEDNSGKRIFETE